jgi:4-hydroxy-tetrahydrodipicolinate reductase
MTTIRLAVLGISGRMGRAIVAQLGNFPEVRLAGALASPTSRWQGQDAGEVSGQPSCGAIVTSSPAIAVHGANVAIDFTLPEATPANLQACMKAGCPLVIGTTGHLPAVRDEIDAAARQIPVLLAPNMSLGVNLLLKLAELTAKALDTDYDIEIFEAHHRHKKDAPSGTALRIGEVVAAARGTTLAEAGDFTRHGTTGARRQGAIGFSVLRGGDIVGEHVLTFAGPGERLELAHRAHDRSGFALGAIKAARWIVGRPAGLYSMQDVLGFEVL